MQNLFNRLDKLAGIETVNNLARWFERIAFVFLILMVLFAPHSIAATQSAWLSGMFFWTLRLFIKPRPKLVRTPLDLALWSFFGWSIVTSIFSYAPDISIDKLRNAGLFLIFYFVVNNLRNLRAVKFLALALISSCLVSAAWSPIQRIIGRGVEISSVSTQSPLARGRHFNHDVYLRNKGKNLRSFDVAGQAENKAENEIMSLTDGDTIVEVEGEKIRTPDELVSEIEKNDATYLECFRTPDYFTVKVQRSDLLAGANSLEKLGIGNWKHNRNWRYAGFYGQIITYAEVLQMIASLTLGLFIALVSKHEFFKRKNSESKEENFTHPNANECESANEFPIQSAKSKIENPKCETRKLLAVGAILAVMIFALAATFTRSAELGFLISAFSIVLANANRKLVVGLAMIMLPVALIGFFAMQQNRKVDFFDKKDASINYRQTVYREGFALWTNNARNFLLGVGMDSVKRYKETWHLYDDGRLEASHFHSTPLQLVVERGLPALLLWFWILWAYARTLLRNLSSEYRSSDWQTNGVILGCFGALAGFFVSSLVNYSLGDGEVAMVFFLLMGLGVSISNLELRIKN